MSKYKLAGLIVGLGAGLIILFVSKILKKESVEKKYDERQMAIRGECYKISYWVLSAMVIVYAILLGFDAEFIHFLGFVGLGLLFLISIGVFAVLCVWNNAYEAINENKQWPLTLGIIGLSNFIIAFANFSTTGFIVNGQLSFPWLNLGCAILIFAVVLTKKLKDNAEEKEEE